MARIQKILAAVDLSHYSRTVLEQAVRMADVLKAELVVANIIHQRDVDTVKLVYPFESRMISPEQFIQKREKERGAAIRKLLEECGSSNGSVRILFRVGIPYRALIELVKREQASLVIMGPKGRGNLEHVMYGTQAEKMFRHCPVPVLSVRYLWQVDHKG